LVIHLHPVALLDYLSLLINSGTEINGRHNGHDEGFQEEETTHEYNLRTNPAPVVHYSDDQWTANGRGETTGEMMEGEDGVLLEKQ